MQFFWHIFSSFGHYGCPRVKNTFVCRKKNFYFLTNFVQKNYDSFPFFGRKRKLCDARVSNVNKRSVIIF